MLYSLYDFSTFDGIDFPQIVAGHYDFVICEAVVSEDVSLSDTQRHLRLLEHVFFDSSKTQMVGAGGADLVIVFRVEGDSGDLGSHDSGAQSLAVVSVSKYCCVVGSSSNGSNEFSVRAPGDADDLFGV